MRACSISSSRGVCSCNSYNYCNSCTSHGSHCPRSIRIVNCRSKFLRVTSSFTAPATIVLLQSIMQSQGRGFWGCVHMEETCCLAVRTTLFDAFEHAYGTIERQQRHDMRVMARESRGRRGHRYCLRLQASKFSRIAPGYSTV
jgi:hypothetical protein